EGKGPRASLRRTDGQYDRVTHQSILPEVPEAGGRKLGVAHRVLDILVPEVVLQCPRVVAVIGKFEPAGVAKHVRMHAEWHLGGLPEPRNHPAQASGAHRRSALAQE